VSKFSQLTKPILVSDRAEAALKFAESAAGLKDVVEEKIVETETRSTHAPVGYRRLTINLPEKLHKKLRLKAVEQNTTATEIIEKLLNKEISK